MPKKINPFNIFKILLAAAMLGFGLYQIVITQDESFVATEATLLEAYSKTHTFYSQERHQTRTRYYFLYQYTFEDKVYTSSRYTHVNPTKSLGVGRFEGAGKGTRFTVYVNPKNPAYAVVQKGQPWFIYVLTLTGLLGAINTFLGWRLHRLFETSRTIKEKEELERVRKWTMRTGAWTALGILATIVMYFFAI